MNTMPKATLDTRALISGLGAATVLLASACSPDTRTASELPNPSFDTVTAVVSTRIGDTGMLDEVDEYIFGDIQSVTADDNGLIYVADRLPPSVRVYRPDGEFLAWVGRAGEGPGEFGWPVDLLAVDDRLYVRGLRVTVFKKSEGSEYPDSVLTTWSVPGYANTDSGRARFHDGIYYYPHYRFPRDEPDQYFYLQVAPGGFTTDTVHVPALANIAARRSAAYWVSARSGRMVRGLNIAPFAARAAWDLTGRATVIAGDGSAYAFQEYGPDGQLLRTIKGPVSAPRPVSRSERADSIAALELRIDSLPVPLDRIEGVAPEIRTGNLPEMLPHFISVHVGSSDRIWVERWRLEGMAESSYFDVLEYDGSYAGTVVVPVPLLMDPPPYFGDDVVIGITMDPETDVHSVAVSRFKLAGRAQGIR